ncbi:MAG: tetratricopeptide repeat protein [Pyrinomonadaceae bacterium]
MDITQEKLRFYDFGEFRLDAMERVLFKNGEPLNLPPKVFDTLLALVLKSGHIVGREELMNEVWQETFVEEANLSVNISALRKMLGKTGEGKDFIETVARRGYRFRAAVLQNSAENEPDETLVVHRRLQARIVQTQIEDGGENANKQISSVAPPNNLGAMQLKLIGREKDVAEVSDLLCHEETRLLTLTGAGGTGKTSLAKTIARTLLSKFKDGVFFVDLSAVHDTALVLPTVAQTLGIKEAGGKSFAEIIKDFLREAEIMLVLDNFEQVIEAAADIAGFFSDAPRLKVLATSRALLHLSVEREFAVAPLDFPDGTETAAAIEQISALSKLENYAAVALFIARARAVNSGFALTSENAQSVAEICRRLDGLPLAIELAAARVKMMSPPMILARLENQLQILTGGARDLPARQQTMRGAIRWSYDLLDEGEQILFEKLSVFSGGFTLEAAEFVGEDEGRKINNAEGISVLDGVASLIDKSLLTVREQSNGEMRFQMLEAVGEFARECLSARGAVEKAVKAKHAEYFLALAERAEPEFLGARQAEWTNRLESEHDNLRDALALFIRYGAAEKALRLTAGIKNFWVYRGYLTEGRRWMETVLAGSPKNTPALQHLLGKNLISVAGIARQQGDYQSARKFYEEGLVAARAIGDKRQIAQANRGLGTVLYIMRDYETARVYLEKGLALSRELNDRHIIAISLNALGELARAQKDYRAARPLFEETLTLSRELGNQEGILNNLNNLGAVLLSEGDAGGAETHYAEALSLAREMGHKSGISFSLDGFAAIAAKSKDGRRAATLAGAADALRQSIGYEIEPTDRLFRDTYLSEARTAIDEKIFAEFYESGMKLKLEEAAALLALAQNPRP